MSGTLLLAHTIDSLDREQLATLLRFRPLKRPAGDTIELAERLLTADSLSHALEHLPVDLLAAVVALAQGDGVSAQHRRELAERGLVGCDAEHTVPLPEVTERLRAVCEARGVDPHTFATAAATLDTALHTALHAPQRGRTPSSDWYAPALGFVQHCTLLFRSLAEEPGKVGRRGSIAASTAKRFEHAHGCDRADTARDLALLYRAGFLAATPQQTLCVTPDGTAWCGAGHTSKWVTLAEAFVAQVPPALTHLLRRCEGDLALAAQHLAEAYPLLPEETLNDARACARDFARLGLVDHDLLTAAGEALLRHEPVVATQAAREVFPEPTPGVYVQPDLSVVVPGLLHPEQEAELWDIAEVEQFGLASTFRITEASLTHALELGYTGDSIREVLTALSLAGIPQPLDYLLRSFAQPDNLVTVFDTDLPGARSRLEFRDDTVLTQVLVDRQLEHLRFSRSRDHRLSLFSQLAPNHVLSALREARYQGVSRAGHTNPYTDTAPATVTSPLQRREREAQEAADATLDAVTARDHTADTERLLELAIREHTPLSLTASVAGRDYHFTVVPLSLAGGRLRARDAAAQMERTIPLDALTRVEAAESPRVTPEDSL